MGRPPDDPALENLVRKYSRLVRAVAARVGGALGRQIAEDVEQEVFVNIWKQLQREQSIDNPSSYIYRSAVRETIRLLNRERQNETTMDEDTAAAVIDRAPTPADRLVAGERGQLLSAAIKALPIDR